jgi:hypothetical protein
MKAMKDEDDAAASSKAAQSAPDDAAKASVESGKPAEPNS